MADQPWLTLDDGKVIDKPREVKESRGAEMSGNLRSENVPATVPLKEETETERLKQASTTYSD